MRECRENMINGQLLWHFPSMHVDFLGLGREDPPRLSLRRTSLEAFCPPRSNPACGHSSDKYRTHDGTCNNRLRPHWGASQMPYQRFLTPDYDDGISTPRRATDGSPLPSARFVSLVIVGANREESPVTLMLAQWGQFIDHDTTATRQPMSVNGSIPSCCGSSTENNPNCFPIKVPFDDPWLAPIGIRCLEFLRSAPTQRRDCTLSWREQTNQVTSFIDASTVYGSTQRQTQNIRLFQNGLLLFGRGSPKEDVCLRAALASRCVRSGDARSNEQPALLALHIIWVQEHNRIAMELGNLNHHWSDEKIYQETRRIIIAMMQHITYREFLPLVLGRVVCQIFGLNLQENGYYKGYNENTNPTTANSYAAAAFRFGHSLIQDTIMRADRHNFFLPNNVSLHEEDQRGDIGGPGSLPRIIRGNIKQRSMKVDEFVTPELTNHLFQNPNARFGLDLAAINIQRGRDHGLPVYTSWRVACGLTAINDWKDLHDVMGSGTVRRLRQAYRSVHDIDVWVGGISERPVVGGLVGPVIACIVAQQFVNFRRGDRFWYENGGFDSSFTPAQLAAIRKTNLAQVLCRSAGGGQMQPFVFLMPGMTGNEYQTCGTKSLTPIDLSPWKEIDPFRHDEEHLNLFDIPATHIMINPFKDDNFVSSKVEHISDNNTKLTTEQTINSKLDLTNITTETNQNVTVSDKLDKPKKTLVAIKRLRKPTKPKKKRPHHRRVDDLLFKNEDNATVYVGNKPLTVDEGGEKSIRDFLLSLTPRPFQIEINIKRTESTKAPPDMTTPTYALRPEVRPTYTTTHKPFGNFDKDKESFISLPQTGSSPFSYDMTTKPHREDENLLHTDVDPGPIFTTYRPNLQTSFHLGGPKKTTTTTTTETVYIVPPNADKDPTLDYQPIQSSPSPNLSPFSTSDSSIFWAKNLSPLLDLDSPVKTKPSVDSKLSSDDFKPHNTYDFDEDYDFTTLPPALNSDLNENDDISPDKIPFDEDGYLRPEHIHLNHTMNDDHIEIIQLEGEELTQTSGKDDFVLPIFTQSRLQND
ncbi:chorion peroxidase-like [Phlebotomus papatasi]|uniref:chorion peroxidase-like n=1 Tax=Phlebotomus papatasi TaxID=29031 RepID=UPI0024845DD2|nr:chorion peroxidase-like [Phlebotomus papatasi]